MKSNEGDDMIKQLLSVEGMLTTTFLILLTGAAYTDGRERRIPDLYVSGILLTALIRLFTLEGADVQGIAAGATGVLAVSVPMLQIALIVPGAFGGGDVKLMAACGLFLGAKDIFYSFFYALILGGVFSIYLILVKKGTRKTRIAFGPFLASGIVLRLIFLIFKG